jgi:hypothetical protein
MNTWSYPTIPHICLLDVFGDLTFTCKLRILRLQIEILILATVITVDITQRSLFAILLVVNSRA